MQLFIQTLIGTYKFPCTGPDALIRQMNKLWPHGGGRDVTGDEQKPWVVPCHLASWRCKSQIHERGPL